jgi:hypothetical protein
MTDVGDWETRYFGADKSFIVEVPPGNTIKMYAAGYEEDNTHA